MVINYNNIYGRYLMFSKYDYKAKKLEKWTINCP